MSKVRSLATRTVHLALVLVAVGFVVFIMLDLLPGDPAEIIISSSSNPSQEAVEELRAELGLDKPLLQRYASWFGDAVRGDLGESYRTGQDIVGMIGSRLPTTLQVVTLAEVVALAVAVPAAIASAQRRGGRIDRTVTFLTFGLQSTPSFILAILFILLFAVKLDWVPATGFVPWSEDPVDNLRSLFIPVLALAAGLVPVYTRLLRNDLIRVLQEDFILMARAMGLSRRTILVRYALKPALPTLVTVIGVNVGALLGGTIIIELISGVPGIGTLLYDAILNRDYLVVQGVVLVIAVAYVVVNAVVDLLYAVLDPRVEV